MGRFLLRRRKRSTGIVGELLLDRASKRTNSKAAQEASYGEKDNGYNGNGTRLVFQIVGRTLSR